MPRGRRAKGTGSIFRRGSSYVAQVQDGFHDSGKPKYRQVTCVTHADAVRALNELNTHILLGRPIPDRKGHTVGSWLDFWMEEHIKPNREPNTYDYYALWVKKVKPFLGRIELQRLSPTDIARAFKSLEQEGATPSTISAVRRTLRAAYGVAMKYGYAHDNPVTRTFAPRVTKTKKVYFDADQVQALLAALEGSPIENLVRFTLATGMRIGEVTGITWDNVDFKQKTVLVCNQLQRVDSRLVLKPLKTEKSLRTMPLVGHSLCAVADEWERQQSELCDNPLGVVFLNHEGRPWDPKCVNEQLHKVLQKAGLPRTGMHSLRHSAAAFMLMAGLNLHQVSRYLGHSQITLTSNLYGHVLDGAMREAAERLQASYS